MSKEDFFRELGDCLRGNVTESEYMETMTYYQEYFREQEASGLGDGDIIQMLGSPRLIARSVIDASDAAEQGNGMEGYYDTEKERYESRPDMPDIGSSVHRSLQKVGIALAVLLALFIVSRVLIALLPIAGILIIVGVILSFIRRR